MTKDFKTYGDALNFCEKYRAPIHQQRQWNIFKMADALLRAYRDGAKEPTVEPDLEAIGFCTKCGIRPCDCENVFGEKKAG